MSKHLDLGCGSKPRNPYQCSELYGVDLDVPAGSDRFKQANLTLQPIPFADSHFDSVSAYDFLEHIPRIFPTVDGLGTRAPFVELMDEIWRVLMPGGKLYAQTPAFPHQAAFQDPTHVNFITWDAHCYFTRPMVAARIYGFKGNFDIVRVQRVKPKFDVEPLGIDKLSRLRQWARAPIGPSSHILWEFKAVKPQATPA